MLWWENTLIRTWHPVGHTLFSGSWLERQTTSLDFMALGVSSGARFYVYSHRQILYCHRTLMVASRGDKKSHSSACSVGKHLRTLPLTSSIEKRQCYGWYSGQDRLIVLYCHLYLYVIVTLLYNRRCSSFRAEFSKCISTLTWRKIRIWFYLWAKSKIVLLRSLDEMCWSGSGTLPTDVSAFTVV